MQKKKKAETMKWKSNYIKNSLQNFSSYQLSTDEHSALP